MRTGTVTRLRPILLAILIFALGLGAGRFTSTAPRLAAGRLIDVCDSVKGGMRYWLLETATQDWTGLLAVPAKAAPGGTK